MSRYSLYGVQLEAQTRVNRHYLAGSGDQAFLVGQSQTIGQKRAIGSEAKKNRYRTF